jgi:hypothetical protein
MITNASVNSRTDGRQLKAFETRISSNESDGSTARQSRGCRGPNYQAGDELKEVLPGETFNLWFASGKKRKGGGVGSATLSKFRGNHETK